jgi:hypothetical protein
MGQGVFMIEVSPIAQAFNNLLPGRPGQLDQKLYALASKGLAATRMGTEEALWNRMYNLLRAGANVNAERSDGCSVLGTICSQNLPLVARHLVEDAGADVNHKSGQGGTPLMMAGWAADATTIKMLLDHGADPAAKNNDRRDVVYEIIHDGREEAKKNPIRQGQCLQALQEGGATISHSDEIYIYHNRPDIEFALPAIVAAKAMVKAAEDGDLKALKTLIDAGNHPDAPIHFAANPPLFYAAMKGDLQMIELLRQSGADARQGHPLLLVAAEHAQRDAFTTLLDMGADPKATYPDSKGVLDYARECGDSGMEAFVKDALAERAAPKTVLTEDIKPMQRLRFKTALKPA